jgi:putative nucleotidyltransferase with HDIG domain
MTPSRSDAWAVFCEFNETDSLRKHALAVEGVMRRFARKRGGDEELWGIAGMLHDLDWEKFPEEHCRVAERILRERGFPDELVRAVVSHGWQICTDVEPLSDLERCLYAVDELAGFCCAVALVRPSRSVLDLEPRSVRKKWKEKAFAAGVDRAIIERGAGLVGMPLDELIAEAIAGLRGVAVEIGLGGSSAGSTR